MSSNSWLVVHGNYRKYFFIIFSYFFSFFFSFLSSQETLKSVYITISMKQTTQFSSDGSVTLTAVFPWTCRRCWWTWRRAWSTRSCRGRCGRCLTPLSCSPTCRVRATTGEKLIPSTCGGSGCIPHVLLSRCETLDHGSPRVLTCLLREDHGDDGRMIFSEQNLTALLMRSGRRSRSSAVLQRRGSPPGLAAMWGKGHGLWQGRVSSAFFS